VAKFDVDGMSLSELRKLKKEVDRAITTYQERRRAEVAQELESIAREKGFTLSELSGAARRKRKPVKPKYRSPDDPAVTWSGRGRRPHWVKEALDHGKSLEDLAI